MTKKPKVDILMATYNGEKYIREQLNSILEQTFDNWHLFIQDDCSTDDTFKILKSFSIIDSRISVYKNEIRLGVLRNFETLMKKSDADYIMFCDQDDVWLNFKIDISIKALLKTEERVGKGVPCLIYTDQQLVDESLCNISFGRRKYDSSLFGILCQNHVYGCTIIFNRALLIMSLPIPNYVIGHDYWLALMASAYGKIEFLNKKTMLYRQHAGNVTGGTRTRSFISKIKLMKKTNGLLLLHIRQNHMFTHSMTDNPDAKRYLGIINAPRLLRPIVAINSGFKMDNKLATLRMLIVLMIYNNSY